MLFRSYQTKAKMMYVQLDKCLEQFKKGMNAEAAESGKAEDGKPDELQLWLSMIADVNDKSVTEAAEADQELQNIRAEIHGMAQDKEVQNMIIQERYDRMDWLTYGDEQRQEGEKIGMTNQKAEDARAMYDDGLEPERIARILKLDIADVEVMLGLRKMA